MTDDTLIHAGDDKLIGVGMGGSCPSCRAPIDLGQEFCLECGAPIRFSTRQQRKGRSSSSGPGTGGTSAPSAPRNFPWLPFGIVLALIVGGIAFAIVGTGDNASSKKEPSTKTQTALPEITNEQRPEEDESSNPGATGLECPTGLPADSNATPNSSDSSAAGGTPGEQIPEMSPSSPGMMGSNDPAADAFPSATPGSSDALPSTEPTDGSDPATNADCAPGIDPATGLPGDGSSSTPGLNPSNPSMPSTSTPSTPSIPSTPPTSTPSTPSSTTGTSWPADKDGWTVVVFGYADQSRANARAADLQEDGFDSGVLFSTDYGSLCPGFYVVFSGVYNTKAQAENQKKRLQGKYQGMLIRKVAKNGSAPVCRS